MAVEQLEETRRLTALLRELGLPIDQLTKSTGDAKSDDRRRRSGSPSPSEDDRFRPPPARKSRRLDLPIPTGPRSMSSREPTPQPDFSKLERPIEQPASTFKKCDGPLLPPLGPRAQSWGVRAPQRPDLNPFSPRPPPTTPSMSRTSSSSTSCDKATPFPVTATSAPAIVAQVDDTHLTLLRETALASLRQNKRKVSSSSLNDSGTTTTTEPSVFTTTTPTSAPASLMSRKPTPPPPLLQQQDYYEAYYGGNGYDDTYYEEPPRDEFSNCIISDVDASSDEEDDEETMAQDCDDNVNGSKSLCPSAKVLKQTREQVVVYLQSLLEEHAYLRQPTQAPATSNGSSDIFLQRERQRVLVEEQIDALEREIERREQEAEVSRAL